MPEPTTPPPPEEVVENVDDEKEEEGKNEMEAGINESKGEESTEKAEKLLHLPFGRVKHMMKLDPDLNQAKADAVFAVAKATELFLESLAVECFSYTEVGGKKTVSKADFDKAVAGADCLAFLEGALDD